MSAKPAKRPSIIAHHLIWTLYGHWLPNDLRGRSNFVQRNPVQEGLPEQHCDFVQSYDHWPFHKIRVAIG